MKKNDQQNNRQQPVEKPKADGIPDKENLEKGPSTGAAGTKDGVAAAEKNGGTEEELKGLKDKYVRLAAEFDNYRKRTEKEKGDIYRYGVESFLQRLIPFDELFEKAIIQMENTKAIDSIHQGLQMLQKEFSGLLGSLGVKKIDTSGKKFDPVLHEAAGIVESAGYEEGVITEELRAGYLLHDKVLRPAMVKVARTPGKQELPPENDESRSAGEDQSPS